MGQDIHVARLKMHDDDSISKHKSRKLENLYAPSALVKKLKPSGSKVKFSKQAPVKNKMEDFRIRSSSISDKSNKITNPSAIKTIEDDGSLSSNSDSSIRSAGAHCKVRKLVEDSVTSRASDRKNEHMVTGRRHLHVRAYKNLFIKHATTGGNLGITDNKDQGGTEDKLQDERESALDARFPSDCINQECQTKFIVSNCETVTPNLDSVNLLVPSGEEMYDHDSCKINLESSFPRLKDLGVGDSGVCDEGFHGTTDQWMSEEKIGVVLKYSTKRSQTSSALKINVCLVCKQPGQVICCYGKDCNQSYHLSCFKLLFHDVPLGAWLCNSCVKKKIESGVYSVSDGIESIWDVDEGMQSGKRYFVKYKGLAHVHNRWIPEGELLQEAPSVFTKFRKRGPKEMSRWKKEWAEPERFLWKRLVPTEVADEYASVSDFEPLGSCNEWFVKWKGLHYDQATWELEDSLLLLSSKTPRLIEDYACRREHTRKSYDPQTTEKSLQVRKDPFRKLSKLPDGCPIVLDEDCLSSLNSLREFWYKSLNAVSIDFQERMKKSILFILSLQSHACRPSLIITTPGTLQLWQADFLRLAPSVNVIMYQGDKYVRKMIQNVEFYDKQGRLMFQVLLADPKAIAEDLDDIACIVWESMIVDKFQNSKITKYLEQLNTINTDFKLLLFNSQLKDSLSEYRLILSFLNNGGAVDDGSVSLKVDNIESSVALTTFKEKLALHIAYECVADSSKFLEYWVAVPLSSIQLEQYCSTLFTNANVLRSNSRSDVVGALHDILITIRKCCAHPYLVDGELRGLLARDLEGVEVLNAEVCASGKLYLLGKILQEIKDRGLRVVILFQTLGELGKVSLGDILDDFLQQRFGEDSYARIENGMIMAKRIAALKKFNSKEAGMFAFLLEKRACLPSVKLLSVDVIVLFDSDWNPLNDLRSLQKIGIESPHNSIKIFRLYTSYTVEEKILMLAKQDIVLENCVHSLSHNISHSLLCWGASYLFRKHDLLHSNAHPTCFPEASFGKICLNDVVSEILTQLPGKIEINKTFPSILMKAQLIGGRYSNTIVLVGEKEDIFLPDKDLPYFWSGLLEGRHPKWKYISGQSQKIRKRIQNINGLVSQTVQSDEGMKKRQKINVIVDSTILPVSSQEILTNSNVASAMLPECSPENGNVPEEIHISCSIDSEGREHKFEEQRNLLESLRPELSELCDILGLPESVKGMAEEFLVYIMNNHEVCLDEVTVLQALKIALCWRAASMSRHKLDRIESLTIAKKKMKFECTEQEACSVYSKLKILKEKNTLIMGSLRVQSIQTSSQQDHCVSGVVSGFPSCSQQDHCLIDDTSREFQHHIESLKDDLLKNQIELVEKVFLTRSEDLVQMQQAEVLNFEKLVYDNRIRLEREHDFDLDLVRVIHVDLTVKKRKEDALTQMFSAKLVAFNQHLKLQKRKLFSMLHDVRNKEEELEYSWLQKAKTSKIDGSFDDLPRQEISFRLESFSEYTGNKNFGAVNSNFTCPSKEKNALSQGYLQVPTVILNGQKEIDKVGDESTNGRGEVVKVGDDVICMSVIVDNVEQMEQNKDYVEPAHLPELAGVHLGILPPRAEDLNTFSSSPPHLLSTGSISGAVFEFEQFESRDDSSCLHFPIPEINQGELTSSSQELANSAPSSSFSSIQESCTNEHGRCFGAEATGNKQDMSLSHKSHSVATPFTHIEVTCNEAPVSKSTHYQIPLSEHETPSVRYQEVSQSVEQAEDPEQPESRDVLLQKETTYYQIQKDNIHSLRSQEYIPSGISVRHLINTDIQQEVHCNSSHPFARKDESTNIEVLCNRAPPSSHFQLPLSEHEHERLYPVQSHEAANQLCHSVEQAEVTRAEVHQRETTNNEIQENIIHQSRSLEYLPTEGIRSRLLRGTDIQQGDECSRLLRGTDIQQGDECNLSLPSVPYAEVPVQDALEATVIETEPSVQQIPVNIFHSVIPQEDAPLERTGSGHPGGIDIQPVQLNQLLQNCFSIEWVSLQPIYVDPIKNELIRIQKQECALTAKYQNKKLQLQLEYEQELEKVSRKYDALLQGAERDYLTDKMVVDGIHHKVSWHKIFAEKVRAEYFGHEEGSSFKVQCQTPSQHHQASMSQPQPLPRPFPTPVPPSSSTTILTSTAPSIPSARLRLPALPARPSSQPAPPLISTHILHRPAPPRPAIQIGRSPAPHLQCFRPHTPLTPATNQHYTQPRPSTSIGTPASIPPGFSQPFISRTSSHHSRAPLLELPQFSGTDDLMESLLAGFPTIDEELLSSNMIDLRSNGSPDVICLSGEE